MKSRLLFSLLLLLVLAAAQAQVPGLVNYQGRVTVGTTNFNSPPNGLFKFALVNTNGTTAYWSNDGSLTLTPGALTPSAQPTNAVSLTVSKGLYSVLLGDTTITNMTTVIPASVFTNPDVRLRVWFNDGVNNSQLLSPDQRLAASGYALMAGGVDLPATTSASTGVLILGGNPFLHAYGTQNTFVGAGAGNFTMTGGFNTASGYQALFGNTTGGSNTASGDSALANNTTGSSNTASGSNALTNNSSGDNNTASGDSALANNTNGTYNTAFGISALHENIHGSDNTGVGRNSGQNITGGNNTVLGNQAGYNLTSGSNNIDIGNYNPSTGASSDVAGESNIIRIGDGVTQTDIYLTGVIHGSGTGLTGITLSGATTISGDLKLPATTSASTGVLQIGGTAFLHAYGASGLGSGNLFVGSGAGNFSQTGTSNTGNGYQALAAETTGSNDTASGYHALNSNTSGGNNTATGYAALGQNSTGSNNIALGYLAGFNLTTGSNNIDIGSLGTPGESNIIRIGSSQTNTYLTGVLGVGTGNALAAVGYPSNWLGLHYDSTGPAVGLFEGTSDARIHLRADSNTANVTRDFVIDNGNGNNTVSFMWLGSGLANRLNTMSIDGNGRVGIGTSTPTAALDVSGNVHISGSGAVDNLFSAAGIGVNSLTATSATINNLLTAGNASIGITGVGSQALYVNRAAGTITRSDGGASWDTPSDIRIKHDVFAVTGALDTLARLRPVRFHYNADFLAKMPGTPDTEHYGVVAQEFQKVFPDYVDTDADGMLSVRMDPVPIVTAAAVQELNAKVNERDARIEALEKENRALAQKDKTIEARLQALEARLGPANP